MDRYKILEVIGEGTFGTVYRAEDLKTNEIVAVKKIKKEFLSWEKGISENEVKYSYLYHENIVEIKAIIREDNTFYYIMEIMDYNLYEHLRDQRQLTEEDVRLYMYQFFQAIAFLHRNDIFHRDLKPENILLRNGKVKICDFGLARSFHESPPFTTYVSTRWYRAPEILLHSKQYSKAVDVWAAGCIMAELLTSMPLFPGINEEDQLLRICRVLGTPNEVIWEEGMKLARQCCFCFSERDNGITLRAVLPTVSDNALDLVSKLLEWNPDKRLTAEEALEHPFFVEAFQPF